MGIRFRKSINLGGGFRINLSKSGVGYSWGIPGYRITKTANGRSRKTYSIPGTGVSYVDEKHSTKRKNEYIKPQIQQDNMMDINSVDVKELQPVEYEELLKTITKTVTLNTISNIAMVLVIFSAFPFFLVVAILGLVLKIALMKWGKIELNYELDQYAEEKHLQSYNAWISLNENKKLWQIIQQANVSNIKINAGASRNVNRSLIRFLKKPPFYISTNVDTVQIGLKKQTMIFLPDKVIVIQGIKAGAVNYDDIQINVGSTRFVESQTVPKDAKIADYTWQYVNKGGGPDRRYKNNRQLPVCLYGIIKISSNNGINVEIQCSSIDKTKLFAENIK